MMSPNKSLVSHFFEEHRSTLLLLAVLSMAIVVGLATVYQPMLGIGLVILLALVFSVVLQPNIATLAVVFILYTNAATVAVKFHGAPSIVSAGFLLLLLIPLVYFVVVQRQPIIVTRVLPLLVIYLLVQTLSALFSARNVELALPNLFTFLSQGLLLYLLFTNAVRTPEMLRRIIWVLLIAGLFMGALSLYQQVTQTLDNEYGGFAQNEEQTEVDVSLAVENNKKLFRQAGPIGEKNRYSQIMLMLVPLGMFRFWGERSKKLQFLAAV